jgi:HAE1 family hydrophobic/amphiphilic exporter-1
VAFKASTDRYGRAFVFLIRHKWVTLVIFAVTIGLLWFSSATMKKGFVPNEDRGIIFTNVELPAGASMERTYNALKQIHKKH